MQSARAPAFDPEQFRADCQTALLDSMPERAVRQVVQRAVSHPAAVLRGLGEPHKAGIQPLYRSTELTILNVVWAPYMTLLPHDHRMWAVIGIYTGREDNIFWRRIEDEPGGKIEAAGARALSGGETCPLGRDIIHSVTNPIPRFTSAIHVYGGEFFTTPRSEWEPESLMERPFSVERAMSSFEEANARLVNG